MSGLKQRYNEEILPKLQKELGASNVYQVPRLLKIVVNIGLGDAAQNAKLLDAGVEELTAITGQKAVITRAKKSIASFKIRQGMPIGVKVTLHGERMYDFANKVLGIALPRVRDFQGLKDSGFDGRGNYNIGLTDQLVFPEIHYDKVAQLRGMNITLVTSATNDRDAKLLMEQMGFPFQKRKAHHPKADAAAVAS
jgi:large subunit ribosomal protein L5